MSTLDVLRKLHRNLSPKVPEELRNLIDVEFVKVANEVKLKEEILECTSCPLHASCTQKVPGEGAVPADIMFVGESPRRTRRLTRPSICRSKWTTHEYHFGKVRLATGEHLYYQCA